MSDTVVSFSLKKNNLGRSDRKDKSFMVPKNEIVKNGYDLTINKYREIEREVVVHRSTGEIFKDIENSKKNEEDAIEKLIKLVNEGEE